MLPIIEVPETMRNSLAHYRDVFCREEGFDHVSRYVTGLILSPNKTLQGIDDLQVWDGELPRRRAMHGRCLKPDGIRRSSCRVIATWSRGSIGDRATGQQCGLDICAS